MKMFVRTNHMLLLEKIAEYLDGRKPDYSYIKDSTHMEIRVNGKEWLPIQVFRQASGDYSISWCGIEYRIEDRIKAYERILRIFTNINEWREAEKKMNEPR